MFSRAMSKKTGKRVSPSTFLKKHLAFDFNAKSKADISSLKQTRNIEKDALSENKKASLDEFSYLKDLFLSEKEYVDFVNNLNKQKEEFNNQKDFIRRKYKGTEKWLKAYNGKKTNLTEEQWLAVRTKIFKRLFGNWQLNINQELKLTPLDKYYYNSIQKEVMEFSSVGELRNFLMGLAQNKFPVFINEDMFKVNIDKNHIRASLKRANKKRYMIEYEAFKRIDKILRNSIFYRFRNNDGQKKHESLIGQDIYLSAVSIKGKIHLIEIALDIYKNKVNEGVYKGHKK